MPEKTTRTQQDTFATLADLQGLRREIHEELSGLRHDLAGFQREITSAFNDRQKTNWQTILTGVSVALLVAGMGAALITAIINAESRQREAADIAQRELRSHMFASITDNIQEDRRDIREIDVVLQREMRLLDEVLQREMGLHVKRLEDLINVNTADIHGLRKELKKYDNQQERRTDRVYADDN